MTMLARLTEVLRRARMRGDWDDERVVLEVLAEMREPTNEIYAAAVDNGDQSATEVWRPMIDAIRADATEPAETSELECE
jgi:hypothetical protein